MIPLPYLVAQHKLEIIETSPDYSSAVQQTFNREFQNMLLVCLFVPFLHKDTPKPSNVTKTPISKDAESILIA